MIKNNQPMQIKTFKERLERANFKIKYWTDEDLMFYEFFKILKNRMKIEVTFCYKKEMLLETSFSLVLNKEYLEIASEEEKELWDLLRILNK